MVIVDEETVSQHAGGARIGMQQSLLPWHYRLTTLVEKTPCSFIKTHARLT